LSRAFAWYPRDGRTGDALLGQANARLKRPPGRPEGVEGAPVEVVPEMQRVREMAARAASSSINVLILGETGVGKEVLARLVHRTSPRAAKPFVALNCAGLAESLIESELFGHEKGAFTGAGAAKVGLIESANGGTVFLDEIGEMPLAMQARLLRVIEAREVLPVGAVRARPIDVRFVSATNRDLDAAVAEGEFRRDLVFRLNGITLQVPPLRERTDEIPALVDTFIAGWCAESGRRDPPLVGQQALDYLLGYPWPGNIRELRNVVERALVLCDGPEILPQHLPLEKIRPIPDDGITFSSPPGGPTGPTGRATPPESRAALQSLPPLGDPKKQAERKRIIDALEACASNQTRAALLLGMSRRTLVSKLGYYGIPRPQKGPHRDGGSGQDGEHP
jgi:DNA-binding NtrC family response regulator